MRPGAPRPPALGAASDAAPRGQACRPEPGCLRLTRRPQARREVAVEDHRRRFERLDALDPAPQSAALIENELGAGCDQEALLVALVDLATVQGGVNRERGDALRTLLPATVDVEHGVRPPQREALRGSESAIEGACREHAPSASGPTFSGIAFRSIPRCHAGSAAGGSPWTSGPSQPPAPAGLRPRCGDAASQDGQARMLTTTRTSDRQARGVGGDGLLGGRAGGRPE